MEKMSSQKDECMQWGLSDFKDILKIDDLQKEKPNIVIIGTECSCGEKHPFIFSGESLYFFTHYICWHQYRECECGEEVSVYSGHGDIIFNPHNIQSKEI